MIDDKPIWVHVKTNIIRQGVRVLSDADVAVVKGKVGEYIGRKIIAETTTKGAAFYRDQYPDVEILSTQKAEFVINQDLKFPREAGDYILELNCKGEDGMYKRVAVFEIKFGRPYVTEGQIRRYSAMLFSPEKYFRKAREVRVFFIFIDKIDYTNWEASYVIGELNKDLAQKILNNEGKELKYIG